MTSRTALERASLENDTWIRETYGSCAWRWTNSGTGALTMAMRLAAERSGNRRVALPAYGCFDLATACDGAGAEGVLYDLDPETLGPDWTSLENALKRGVGSAVVVHLYGLPVELDRVRAMTARAGVLLIEDAAQAVGASYAGQPCGSLGDLAVLSFGRGKGLTAGGGGALLVNDRSLQRLIESEVRPAAGGSGIVGWMMTAVQYLLSSPALYAIPARLPFLGLGETPYHAPKPVRGISRSAVGILATAREFIQTEAEGRRSRAAQIRSQLAELKVMIPREPARGVAGFLRIPVLFPNGQTDLRVGPEERQAGISAAYPVALDNLSGFSTRDVSQNGEFPGAARLVARLATLPSHSNADQKRLMRSVRSMFGARGERGGGVESGSGTAGRQDPQLTSRR